MFDDAVMTGSGEKMAVYRNILGGPAIVLARAEFMDGRFVEME